MQNSFEDYYKKEMIKPVAKLQDVFKETEELIAIIAKSIDTAQKNKSLSKFEN